MICAWWYRVAFTYVVATFSTQSSISVKQHEIKTSCNLLAVEYVHCPFYSLLQLPYHRSTKLNDTDIRILLRFIHGNECFRKNFSMRMCFISTSYCIIYGSALKSAWSHMDLHVSSIWWTRVNPYDFRGSWFTRKVDFVLTSWELILLV